MRYVIKCDTTGTIGRHEHAHRVLILNHSSTRDEALAALRAKRASLQSSSFTTFTLGPDSDFYVYCRSPRLNCIDRLRPDYGGKVVQKRSFCAWA